MKKYNFSPIRCLCLILCLLTALILAGCFSGGEQDTSVDLTTADVTLSGPPAGKAFPVDYSEESGYELDYLKDPHSENAPGTPLVLPLSDRYLTVSIGYYRDPSAGDEQYRWSICVYDMLTGELIYNADDLDIGPLQASTGCVYSFDRTGLVLYYITADSPDKVSSCDLKSAFDGIIQLSEENPYYDGSVAVSGRTFYFTCDRSIYAVDLDTMERRTVLTLPRESDYMGNVYPDVVCSPFSDRIIFDFTVHSDYSYNNYSYLIEPDGSCSRLYAPQPCSLYLGSDGRYYVFDYSDNEMKEYQGVAARSIGLPEDYFICAVKDDQFIACLREYDTDYSATIRGYSLDRGEMTMIYRLPKDKDPCDYIPVMGGRFIAITDFDGSVCIIPYDPMGSVEPPDDAFTYDPEPATEMGNHARAHRLTQEYGVFIHIYDDAVKYFGDFAAVSMTHDQTIHDALIDLEECLSQYPKDFFAELTSYGELHELHIMLLGKLIPGDENSVSNPIGYACTNYTDKQKLLAINVESGEFKNSVYHEIMHYIDEQVDYAYLAGQGDGLLRWNEFNPPDPNFTYNYSYVDENGEDYNNKDYTVGYSDDPYFLSAYCKTFAGEDKCRTYEAVMGFYEDAVEYPHIKAKMQYLITSLQGTFKTWSDLSGFEWYRNLFGLNADVTE